MELTLRPFITAGVALTAAGAIALAPVAPPTPAGHLSAPRVSAQAVRLTDYWSDLIGSFTTELGDLVTTASGGDPGFPLPPGINPVVPILQQFVLNQIGYVGDLLALNPAAIVTGVTTHLNNLVSAGTEIAGMNLALVFAELYAFGVSAPIGTFEYVAGNFFSNPLLTLIEAPAVFLGPVVYGDVYVPTYFTLEERNLIAEALDPPLPSWLSGLAPAAATPNATAKTVTAAATPNASTKTGTLNVTPPTGSSTPVTANTSGTKTGGKLATTGTTGTTPATTVPKGGTTVSTTTQTGKLGTQLNTAVKTVTTQLNAPLKKVSEVGKKR